MDLDFLEIGTSNFDTCIQSVDDSKTGISIDAISYYLDCLPNKPNIRKIHAAITSDRTSDSIKIYYIPEEDILKHNLYNWFKGCNKIGEYHPLHVEHNLTHLVKIEDVPLVNIDELLIKHNIRKIKYLKIDTEGHDCVILNGLFKYLENKDMIYYPDLIEFESNQLVLEEQVDSVIQYAERIGYKCIARNDNLVSPCNTLLVL